ncbi:MAG TPA: hypothetical protein VMC03_02140 [Streptosporangiaceae bacterium]|nr:hypothetical protein [Streptosporangiaceae bacterium]
MASPDTPRRSRAKKRSRRKPRADVLARFRPLEVWLRGRWQWLHARMEALAPRLAPVLRPLRPVLEPVAALIRRLPRRVAVATSAVAAVAVGVALALVFTVGGGSAHPAAGGSGSADNGKTVSKLLGGDHRALPPGAKESTFGGAAAVARSAGALPLPSRLVRRAIAWRSGRGGTLLATVSLEYGSVSQAGGMKQFASMRYNCEQLASSVSAAQAGPRIPDAAMQKLYARALAELATAASHCRAAISQQPDGDESIETHEDPQLFSLTKAELTAGSRDLYRATAEIQAARLRKH